MVDFSKNTTDKTLGVDEECDEIIVIGKCDIVVHGLTTGSVKLQYKLTETDELPSPTYWDHPIGEFTEDTFCTIFVSSVGVKCKLIGATNNDGVYVRLSRHLND